MNFESFEKLSLVDKVEIINKRLDKYKVKFGEEIDYDMELFLNIDNDLVNESGGDVERTIDLLAVYY